MKWYSPFGPLLLASLALPTLFGATPSVPTVVPMAGATVPHNTANNTAQKRAQAFLAARLVPGHSAADLRMRGMKQALDLTAHPRPHLLPLNQNWQPVGPLQITSTRYGALTGRVTSVAIDPSDAAGNHIYIGTTGGGVWKSANAAAGDPTTVTFTPLLDTPAAFSGVNLSSISIGAVSVQPGGTGVVLAGTGDPNDALDSYYGAGILRSTDGGTTWSLITQSDDAFNGDGFFNYSFTGEAFAGFAWSTTSPGLVVAAVTHSLDGTINNVDPSPQVSETGLYYSTDAGQTWLMATIEDGANQIIQSPTSIVNGPTGGNPATSVVWDPVRQMFFAAVRYHGYYQSADGMTWTRMANQPGAGLTTTNCPANPGLPGSQSCPIYRGVLAVQATTGDLFALSVDVNDLDQGLWQDICRANGNGCANPTVQFAQQIQDTALDSASGDGTIPQGTYNLALAAMPNNGDTLLFAGTADIFRCSLAAGCQWRNTTNTATCAAAMVAPAQHAMGFLAPPAGQTLPLIYFGNDGGLWRSTDGVNQTGAVCSPSDAAHYQNLNGGLGSLSETTGLASSAGDANTILAGFGSAGTAASTTATDVAYGQLLPQAGGLTAIDPIDPSNWYAAMGPGVSIGQCTAGASCTTADFGSQPAVGPTQTSNDESLTLAPWLLDPQDPSNILVGTCRVWRGPASGGIAWGTANAISPMLDGHPQPSCNGNALVRSLAAGGANVQSGSAQNSGAQVVYAGMAGLLDGGGNIAGHVLATQTANTANGTTPWTDLALNKVVNEQSYQYVFNPQFFDVSSLYVDPHDATGMTVYATIQGFSVPHLYQSTSGGAQWTNITQDLPDLPLNAVVVDPNNANIVYAASDGGVFVAENVALCAQSGGQCWNTLGVGLPRAPAVALSVVSVGSAAWLRVGTYGRGIWQIPLLSGATEASMTLAPTSLTFGNQAEQTTSAPQTVTVTNTSTVALLVSSVTASGDFGETNNCTGTIAPSGSCQVQVAFAPTATGTLTGVLTVFANVPGGQQTVSLTGTGVAPPQMVLEPTVLNFGNQVLNTTSSAQQLTISNTGGEAVSLTSETVTGSFAIQTNTCGSSLAPQTGCTLAITFTPTQAGPSSGVLTVVTAQGTQTVALSGTGEDPATDTLAPLSLSFAPTQEFTASAPQTVTLTNSGGVPLTAVQVQTNGDFTTVNGCNYTLNAGSSCTLTVTYTPHATGPETGAITVTDILRTQTVTLSGTGLAPPTDTLSASSLSFPVTVVGQSAPPQTITMTNSGDLPLDKVAMQTLGAGFAETNTCGSSLAAHSVCNVTVTFTPQAAGSASGQLDVADANRTQEVTLSGSAETPAGDNLTPTSLTFAAQAVGSTSAAQSITLSNHGGAMLEGVKVQSSSADFPLTTTCGATLAAGSSCSTSVSFAPQAVGQQTGTVTVTDSVRTQTVALTGTGILGNIALAPATLNFGVTGVQIATQPQALVLTNGSSGALTGLAVSVSGPFSQSSNCPSSLAAGASCNVQVVFGPSAAGAASGLLTVTTTDAGTLQASLTGTGIDFQLSAGSSTSVSVANGNAASYVLNLLPANGSVGAVSFSCGNLPPNATCTINPATAPLTGPAVITVSVATGVGTAAQTHLRVRRAGALPSRWWLLWLGLAPIGLLRCRRRKLLRRWQGAVWLGLLLVLLGNTLACGMGGGPLGANAAPDPLPASSMTPSGTYTLTATGSAGGLQKSVTLTLIVQ
ncbi:MAG: choice-of-anchor D domain-containing protein [Acidobacteriaceae bacterium]